MQLHMPDFDMQIVAWIRNYIPQFFQSPVFVASFTKNHITTELAQNTLINADQLLSHCIAKEIGVLLILDMQMSFVCSKHNILICSVENNVLYWTLLKRDSAAQWVIIFQAPAGNNRLILIRSFACSPLRSSIMSYALGKSCEISMAILPISRSESATKFEYSK